MFLGDGEEGADSEPNMMMAVARFLQKHTKYISVLVEGYPSFHQEQTSPSSSKNADQV